jgi:hypothetical protein
MKGESDMLREKFSKLIEVKSLVTLTMTAVMAALLLGKFEPSREMLALFSTAYGAIITYFFTRKNATTS